MTTSELTGSLLIAMPQLLDPNFHRTVVLLVEHDEGGTFGLVLNRPAEMSARELCASLDVDWHGDSGADVHWGGPVQPETGWLVFGDDRPPRVDDGLTRLDDDLYFAGSLDVLRALADAPPPDLRLFLGYAGWASGQLEHELVQGAWIVAPLSRQMIFGVPPESLWEVAVRGLGIDPATLISTSGVH